MRFHPYQEENKDGNDGAGGGDNKGADAQGLLAEAARAAAAKAAGGGDDKGGGGDEAARAAAAAAAAAGPKKGADGKFIRPDDMPEQFWDADKGEVRTAALTKAWKDTRTELEKAKAGTGKPPEKPEDYKLELPADIKLPGGKLDENDKAVALFRNVAHKAGLSNEKFNEVLGGFLKEAASVLPPPVDVAEEKKILGPNADAVVAAVHAWGENFVKLGLWSKDDFEEIIFMGSTARGIAALDKLRVHYGEKPIPLDGATMEGLPSVAELYAMVADPKYQTDEAFRKDVEQKFIKVLGTAPAGTSPAGMGVPSQPLFST